MKEIKSQIDKLKTVSSWLDRPLTETERHIAIQIIDSSIDMLELLDKEKSQTNIATVRSILRW